MLPLYKLLSVLLRVTSRPLINFTKRYHANNQIQNDWVRRQFFKLGSWYHAFQTRINRRYLKIDPQNITIKPLSQTNTVDKGIEFFYELIFYSIAIFFPVYEIYRNVVDSKTKEKKLTSRVQKIKDKISTIHKEVDKLKQMCQQGQWQVRHLSYEVSTNFLLFCHTPLPQQLNCCIQLLKKHTHDVSVFKIKPQLTKLHLLM